MWKCKNCGMNNQDSELTCTASGTDKITVKPVVHIGSYKVECPSKDKEFCFGRNSAPGITDGLNISRNQMRFYIKGDKWVVANISRNRKIILNGKKLNSLDEYLLEEDKVYDIKIENESFKLKLE